MRRNWDLFRKILEIVEECDGGYPVVATNGAVFSGAHFSLDLPDHDFGEVCEHMLLLGDAGLAQVRELGRTQEGPAGVAIDRLTMAGHDFLSSARDDQRWDTAMTMVKDKGGAVTVGVLSQILAALLKQSFGIS
ncbi:MULTISPECIES: DUF2513 domain-containing protein [unclassified Synechococcus]|uniref:DUF2513 domain-containing protein n=1 Tax=unclassified Synechococcus TaxID=2626047 RepID=UPI0025708BFB|nr:DUF2513 domain-containing protein [Synechococcus sp. CCAP 1479/13]